MPTPATRTSEVLLVEDHAETRSALLHLLNQQGYSIVTADNGQQVLDLLDGGLRPRLILLDLMLPAVNGRDLLDHLHADEELRLTPVIVITGVEKERVQHVVADAVLHKPLDFERLLITVRDILAKNA